MGTVDYKYASDYDDAALAELYDRSENYTDDVALIRRLIGKREPLRVLECFCGTGRIAVPLIQDGHCVTGIDIAGAMIERARAKCSALGAEAESRARWICGDVFGADWGSGFELIILGGNAFYELPSAAMQQQCIELAARAASPAGLLFVDNNDFRGSWSLASQPRVIFEGIVSDGSIARYGMEELSFDESTAILRMKRTMELRRPDGLVHRREYLSKKHPVSKVEIQRWLEQAGWLILNVFGDRSGAPYGQAARRAIFWAQRQAS